MNEKLSAHVVNDFGSYLVRSIAIVFLSMLFVFLYVGQSSIDYSFLNKLTFSNFVFFCFLIIFIWLLNLARISLFFYRDHGGIGFFDLFQIYLATEFVSKTTPMGVGAPLAALFFLRPYQYSATYILMVFSVMAFSDAIALFSIIAFCVGFNHFGWLVFALTGVLFLGVFYLFYGWYKSIYRCLLAIPFYSGLSPYFLLRLKKGLVAIHRLCVKITLISRKKMAMCLCITFMYWVLYLSLLYFCAYFMGVDLSWMRSLVVQITSMVVGHFLLVPAGVGGAELMATHQLVALIGVSAAVSVVFLWRFLVLYSYLLFGGAALFFTLKKLARKQTV